MKRNLLSIRPDNRLAAYSFLRKEVHRVLAEGLARAKNAVDTERTRTYLAVGKLLDTHLLFHKDRARYGGQVIFKLSQSLGVSKDLLYQSLRLSRERPIFEAPRKLGDTPQKELEWTDQINLLKVPNRDTREKLGLQAQAFGWTTRRLADEIRKLRPPHKPSPARKPLRALVPKQGKTGLYQILESSGRLALDLGFRRYEDLAPGQAQGLRPGDLVEAAENGAYRAAAGAKLADLYTYRAEITKVIDGDTFWVKIYLTSTGWIEEKLRLRGVDTPERNTADGRAAKRFVENLLKASPWVTIRTTKHPDKWDRYLADVFLPSKDGPALFLNQLLLDRRHARLAFTYHDSDWEKS